MAKQRLAEIVGGHEDQISEQKVIQEHLCNTTREKIQYSHVAEM